MLQGQEKNPLNEEKINTHRNIQGGNSSGTRAHRRSWYSITVPASAPTAIASSRMVSSISFGDIVVWFVESG
jgi:hypothetical protein